MAAQFCVAVLARPLALLPHTELSDLRQREVDLPRRMIVRQKTCRRDALKPTRATQDY